MGKGVRFRQSSPPPSFALISLGQPPLGPAREQTLTLLPSTEWEGKGWAAQPGVPARERSAEMTVADEGPGPKHGGLGLGEGWLEGQGVSRGSLSPDQPGCKSPSFTAAAGGAQDRKWSLPSLLKGTSRNKQVLGSVERSELRAFLLVSYLARKTRVQASCLLPLKYPAGFPLAVRMMELGP